MPGYNGERRPVRYLQAKSNGWC